MQTKIFFYPDKSYMKLCIDILESLDYTRMSTVDKLVPGSYYIHPESNDNPASHIGCLMLKERQDHEGEAPGIFGAENDEASELMLKSLLQTTHRN